MEFNFTIHVESIHHIHHIHHIYLLYLCGICIILENGTTERSDVKSGDKVGGFPIDTVLDQMSLSIFLPFPFPFEYNEIGRRTPK